MHIPTHIVSFLRMKPRPKAKGKGKPKTLKVTEDELTWFIMEQALYNPKISPEQGGAMINENLAARKMRERAARQKAEKLRKKREAR